MAAVVAVEAAAAAAAAAEVVGVEDDLRQRRVGLGSADQRRHGRVPIHAMDRRPSTVAEHDHDITQGWHGGGRVGEGQVAADAAANTGRGRGADEAPTSSHGICR